MSMGMAELDDFATDEDREAHVASTEAAMRAAGIPTEESVPVVDYFAFEVDHRVPLDKTQWIDHREFNEGQRKKYLNALNRDMVVQRTTGDMRVKMAPGDERHALLKVAITGWYLVRGPEGQQVEVPFNTKNRDEFLEKAPPKIIDVIEKAVRKANPWLMAEMSLEDIDKEMANLQEMRDIKVKEEEGNVDSLSK